MASLTSEAAQVPGITIETIKTVIVSIGGSVDCLQAGTSLGALGITAADIPMLFTKIVAEAELVHEPSSDKIARATSRLSPDTSVESLIIKAQAFVTLAYIRQSQAP